MRRSSRHGIVLLALLAGLATATAQPGSTIPELQDGIVGRGDPQATKLRLTEAQKGQIAESVRKANKPIAPPPSFTPAIGEAVPPVIELYLLPDDVLAQVPHAKAVKYTVVQNELVLVDPTTMRVVDIIPK